MALDVMFFRFSGGEEQPTLLTKDVILRPPSVSDYEAWSQVRLESREFLQPWEPTWPPTDLLRTAFKTRIRRYSRERRDGTGYAFFLFNRHSEELMGGLTLSNVRRGVTQACTLGYWMGVRYAGKGFMRQSVSRLLPFVFEELKLHRLEAACLPHNEASINLLKRVGFQQEGYARRYLYINGQWQDHLLFAILKDDAEYSDTISPQTQPDGENGH
ncbi:GNAT family protein [Pseudovibrio sp. SPO723]|uniref:GNAT family N-acetyltransferase n=1 Tax=Nesiotobacter zosterae TaxID=392721 RepID=UPI0029C44F13|nr:GNAT family protein [Pseudovibrio sp. SPO723]MDX5593024.1 GNAT family protein [Pseudovibrio sp. SPO723]